MQNIVGGMSSEVSWEDDDDDELLKLVFGGMSEKLHGEATQECSISVSALFWE